MKYALHAKLGLLHGFYHYQEHRGLCEVRGFGSNQWLAAAKGLGLYVPMIRFKDEECQRIIQDPGPSPRILTWGHYKVRQLHPNITVGFSNVAGHGRYWITWLVPHVFFADLDSVLILLESWQECSRTFDHWTFIGSTTACWRLVVWYPPDVIPCEPVTAPTQLWIPLHA